MLEKVACPLVGLVTPNDHAVRLHALLDAQFDLAAGVEADAHFRESLGEDTKKPHPAELLCEELRLRVAELEGELGAAQQQGELAALLSCGVRRTRDLAKQLAPAMAQLADDARQALRHGVTALFSELQADICSKIDSLGRRLARKEKEQAKAREGGDVLRCRLQILGRAVGRFARDTETVLFSLGVPSQISPEPQKMDAWWCQLWEEGRGHIQAREAGPASPSGSPRAAEAVVSRRVSLKSEGAADAGCDELTGVDVGSLNDADVLHFHAAMSVARRSHSVCELAAMFTKLEAQLGETERELELVKIDREKVRLDFEKQQEEWEELEAERQAGTVAKEEYELLESRLGRT